MSPNEQTPPSDHLENFRRLRDAAAVERKVTDRLKEQELDTYELLGKPWDSFAENAEEYLEVFEDFFPGVTKSVKERLATEKREHHQADAIDLAGAADASLIGATHTICITLQDIGITPKDGQTILAGNLLSKKGLRLLIDAMEKIGARPTVVFFRPVAAAYNYALNEYSYLLVSRVLSAMYERLVPGGEMLVDLRWIPVETDNLYHKFSELFARGRGAHVTRGFFASQAESQLKNIYRIVKPVETITWT